MVDDAGFIAEMENKVYLDAEIKPAEAERLLNSSAVLLLAESANRITRKFSENLVDVEMLLNAKTGS